MTVRDVYYVLFKHLWRIIFYTSVIILGLIVFSFVWPPTFQARASFLLQKTTSTITDPAIFPQATTQMLRTVTGDEEANNERQIILSRPVLESVVKRLDLSEDYVPAPPAGLLAKIHQTFRDAISFVKSLPRRILIALHIIKGERPPEVKLEKAIRKLKDKLIVQQVADSDVLQIAMEGWYPPYITQIVNVVGEEYLQSHLRVHQSPTAGDFYEDHLETARARLDELEGELADYRSKYALISIDKRESTLLEKIEVIERERINLQREMITLRAKLERHRALLADPDGPIIPSPELNNIGSVIRLHDMQIEAEIQLSALLDRYTPEHPLVQEAQAQVDRLRGQIRGEVQRLVELEEAQLADWDAEDQALALTLRQLEASGRELPMHRLRLEQLDRAIGEGSGLYEAILKKREDARLSLAQDDRMGKVRLIEPATMPYDSVWPDLFLNLLVGVPLAPVIAISLAFLSESLRTTYRRDEDVEESLEVKTLAVLPRAGGWLPGARREERLRNRSRAAIRALALEVLQRQEAGPLELLVTESTAGEGAPFVIGELAETLARQGRRVLLVGGRAGGERAAHLGAPSGPDDEPRATTVQDLFTWQLPIDGQSLSTTAELRDGLTRVARGFDVVLIEGAPVLDDEANATSAGLTARALLVIRCDATGRTLVERARDRLREGGTTVIGAVLTDFKAYIPAALDRKL